MPIRVVRSALLRLVVILLDMAAAGVHAADGDELQLVVAATDRELVVHLPSRRTPSPYAMALAEASGASLLTGDGVLELRIPTLVALRAR